MEKSRVLVVGGTGYIGKRIVKASLAQGHPTYVLQRPEIGFDVDKLQILLSFKAQGACLVEASLDDHRSLVLAVKQVDVVVSAMSGVHFRSHYIMLQLKLVEAIKEAGNVKIGLDIDKLQTLLSFKAQGARLVETSFDHHGSLVGAVKPADVVVSAMSGTHFLLQLKLVEAIKGLRFTCQIYIRETVEFLQNGEIGKASTREECPLRRSPPWQHRSIPAQHLLKNKFLKQQFAS